MTDLEKLLAELEEKDISGSLYALNIFLIVSIIAVSFLIYSYREGVKAREAPVAQEKVFNTDAFNNLKLEAKAAYVFDLAQNKVIFEKNADTQLPLASVTKLMTALTAVELVPKDSGVTVRKDFLSEDGDTGLLADENWKLSNLLDFSLMVSSNDGARSVASVVGALNLKTTDYDIGRRSFISKMNEEASKIGLKQTYFINETGLDEGDRSGGYGSARDIGNLLKYILINNPELVEATKYKKLEISSEDKKHEAKNTNIIVSNIPGLLASKTGYTDMAGGNLAVAFDPSIGHPLIVVILGSSERGRFNDTETLVKASLQYEKQ